MADVFTFVFLILGFWLALPALCLVLRAFWPDAIDRAQVQTATRPWRCFFVGLAVAVPGFVFALIVISLPAAAKPIGLLMFAGLFAYGFAGISGLVTHLGQRLRSPADAERPWLATARGAVCLVMPATIPILGWFLICPAAFLLGAGAMTLALFNRGEPAVEPTFAPAALAPQPASGAAAQVLVAPATPPVAVPAVASSEFEAAGTQV